MFPYMDLLQPYGQYWFVTITPYGKEIEPGVPDKDEVIESFQKLSRMVGVDCNGCMAVSTYEKALKGHLCIPKQAPKRPECACFLGNDIGAYHTCGHLCRYCYANDNAVLVRENRKHHNPNSPFLIGESRPEDVIHQAKQEKWLDTQMSLFDYMDM